jgi:hypothetical protein
MGRKSRDGDEARQLVMDEDLASLYVAVRRLKLHRNLERAIVGTMGQLSLN